MCRILCPPCIVMVLFGWMLQTTDQKSQENGSVGQRFPGFNVHQVSLTYEFLFDLLLDSLCPVGLPRILGNTLDGIHFIRHLWLRLCYLLR